MDPAAHDARRGATMADAFGRRPFDQITADVEAPGSAISLPRPIPGGPSDVDAALRTAAAQWPAREALVGRYARYTFASLEQRVEASARFLHSLGVTRGDRVAATGVNDPDLVVAFLATMRLGAVWVGIGRALTANERGALIANADARVYLAEAGIGDVAGQLRHVSLTAGDPNCDWARGLAIVRPAVDFAPVDPRAPAAIAYTSGTTGIPKGAVHSQHNIVCLAAANRAFGRGGQWTPDLRRGVALPLTILNLMAIGPVTALVNAAACVCMDRMDVLGIAEWIARERIETFGGAPTTIYDLLTRPEMGEYDLSSLVVPTAGGGHISDELQALYRERFGVALGVGYGLTEALAGVAETDPHGVRPAGSCGRAYRHIDIGIDRGDGAAAAPGEPGEIRVRAVREGPWADVYTPMLGYWRRSEATATALRDGWLYTGDIGSLDADGFLFVKDRRNDLIIRGGANVYPAEVESVLAAAPGVRTAAVVGIADERLGERVAAVIETDGVAGQPVLEMALRERCAAGLARYKHPELYFFTDAMPRNAMNKVVKARLRAWVAAQRPSA